MDERAIAQSLAEFVKTPAGNQVLCYLGTTFGANPFCPDNPHQTSFNCGAQKVLDEIGRLCALADEPPRQETADV